MPSTKIQSNAGMEKQPATMMEKYLLEGASVAILVEEVKLWSENKDKH